MERNPEENKTEGAGATESGTAKAGGVKAGMAGAGTRTRLAWPDWIRGAAIIAVVSVHLSGVSGFPENPLLLWFNSFAMAVFFFVSGDLMIRGRKPSVGSFAKHRAAAVLWPFFTFSVLAVFFDYAVLRLNGGQISREMVIVWMRCIFTLVGKGTLWFLPVFFFGSVLAFAALAGRNPAKMKKGRETGQSEETGQSGENGESGAFTRPCIWEILVFLAGLGAMAFIDRIFAVTVAAVTGGGDGIASDIFLVVIRSLAAAAIILEGAWVGPVFDRIVGTKKGMPAAILCFAVSLVIPAVYRMDFRTAQFGRFPVLLLISAAAAYGFLRQAAELLEKYSSVFTYFGRYSLIVMATHLEWYLVNLVWGGVAAVAGQAADFGPGYLARHLAALTLVMMIEYPLCGIIDRSFGFLLRLPEKQKP